MEGGLVTFEFSGTTGFTDFRLDGRVTEISSRGRKFRIIIFQDRGIRFVNKTDCQRVSLDTVQIYIFDLLSLTDYGSHHLIVSR